MLMLMANGKETKTVSAAEFEERPLALLEEVARTGEPLDVTREGKLLVRIVPPQRSLEGTLEFVGDIVEPVWPSDSVEPSETPDLRANLRGSVKVLGDILAPSEDWESEDGESADREGA